MKKTIAIIAMVVILVACLVMLTGCTTKPSGKYNFVSMTMGGETMTKDDLEELGMGLDDFYLEFLKGDKFKMCVFGEEMEGTFKLDGKKVTLTIDEEDVTGTIDGKKITIEEEDESMVFEKK